MRVTTKVLTFVLSVGLLVSSCGGNDDDEVTEEEPAGDPAQDDEIGELKFVADFPAEYGADQPPEVVGGAAADNPFSSNLVAELESNGYTADVDLRFDEDRSEGETVQCAGQSYDGPYTSDVEVADVDAELREGRSASGRLVVGSEEGGTEVGILAELTAEQAVGVFETGGDVFSDRENDEFAPLCLEVTGTYTTFGANMPGFTGRFDFVYKDGQTTMTLRAEGADDEERSGGQDRDSIGTATMEDDGTIILMLTAEGEGGITGEGVLEYPPEDPEYQSILDHLGGLEPGETKRVPPFPDE